MQPLLLALVLSGILLAGCRSERWELPAALGGSFSRTHNYARSAAEPPQLVFSSLIAHTDSSGCIQPPLPLSSQRLVVATADGSLVAISGTEPLWTFRFPAGAFAAAALAADTATLYAVGSDGMLYALSFEGSERWRQPLFQSIAKGGGPYIHPLPLRDGVVVGDVSGRILCFSSTGELRWEHRRGFPIDRLPAADAHGTIVLVVRSSEETGADSLVLIEATGHQRWARALMQTRVSCSPVFGQKLLFVGGVRSAGEPTPVLHAFSEAGELLWSQVLPAVPRWISVDDSNRVYVVVHSSGIGEPISGVLAYDKAGNRLWSWYLRATITTPFLLFRKAGFVLASEANGALGAYTLELSTGTLQQTTSLEEAPPLLLQPAVAPDGSIVIGWSSRLGLLRFGEHPWRWLF